MCGPGRAKPRGHLVSQWTSCWGQEHYAPQDPAGQPRWPGHLPVCGQEQRWTGDLRDQAGNSWWISAVQFYPVSQTAVYTVQFIVNHALIVKIYSNNHFLALAIWTFINWHCDSLPVSGRHSSPNHTSERFAWRWYLKLCNHPKNTCDGVY